MTSIAMSESSVSYLRDNFNVEDRIAVALLNKRSGAVLQRVASIERVVAPEYLSGMRADDLWSRFSLCHRRGGGGRRQCGYERRSAGIQAILLLLWFGPVSVPLLRSMGRSRRPKATQEHPQAFRLGHSAGVEAGFKALPGGEQQTGDSTLKCRSQRKRCGSDAGSKHRGCKRSRWSD